MLNKIKLTKDINHFYKHFYEGTYTKLRVRDLGNRDWLSEVQYDINEVLSAYEGFYKEAYEVYGFLTSIYERINNILL